MNSGVLRDLSALRYLRFMKQLLFIVIVSALSMTSCQKCHEGIGERDSERRVLQPYTDVVASVDFNVSLVQLPSHEQGYVVINAQPNLIPYIKTDVTRGTLNINVDGCLQPSESINVMVYANNLNSISMRGSGTLKSLSYVQYPDFNIDVRGSGDAILKVISKNLTVNNSGSALIYLEGTTETLKVDSRGSGKIDLNRMQSEDATVDSRGSGEIWLNVRRNFDVSLKGSGNVIYRGNPQNINQSNKGSGNIRRAS